MDKPCSITCIAQATMDGTFGNFCLARIGNSGGPLLDSSGKLIGMNTAIYSPSGASSGIGFAIPVDTVQFIAETLIRDGQGEKSFLVYREKTEAKLLKLTGSL